MGKEKTLVEVTVQQGVATVLLNDPEKRNALSISMADALTAALKQVWQAPQVRCSVQEVT